MGLPGFALAAVRRTEVPVAPDRDTARSWAAEELSGREYQSARPGLLSRLGRWLLDHLSSLPGGFGGTGARFVLLAVVLVAVVAIWYAVRRSGGFRLQARGQGGAVFGDRPRTAADHRAAAEAAEQVEDWRTAVVEWFRTVTRELEERAVLVPQPGRTADEVAADAGAWLPELAQRLRRGAELFDDVRYGDRPATSAGAADLRTLDDAVRRAKPVAQAIAVTDRLVVPS
jgi:hypothetical protein